MTAMKHVLNILLMTVLASANIWDNLWSNNQEVRVVFPMQFETVVTWNASLANGSQSGNNSNYIQMEVYVDGINNEVRIDYNFATLGLEPQELFSVVGDLEYKKMYLRQEDQCRIYDIPVAGPLPNAAQIFDLWPYFFYYNGTQNIEDSISVEQYVYEYPLANENPQKKDHMMQFFFNTENMNLNRVIVQAQQLNIKQPFTIFATVPITASKSLYINRCRMDRARFSKIF